MKSSIQLSAILAIFSSMLLTAAGCGGGGGGADGSSTAQEAAPAQTVALDQTTNKLGWPAACV
ncbi:MAG TPA: hypothetical protein PLP17_14055, partial [Oligoflexia bacterium]|nr:hypothetical protein [Oligoflexia bacterium]